MLHLYYKTQTSKQVQEIIDAFEFCESIDVSKVDSVRDDDIYIVEIDKVQKELLLHLRKLLIGKNNPLIYFFTNDSTSLILFQLASLLEAKSIITKKSDIPKTILSIKKDFLKYEKLNLSKDIVKILENEHYFLIYKDEKLEFASQKIYDDFKFNNLGEIESKIDTIFDLQDNSISSINQKKYKTINKKIDLSAKTFIYIENISQNECSDILNIDFIKSRIYFIEVLKEQILQKSIDKSNLGIITIQIENISNLKNDWNEYDIEIAIRDLLLQVKINIAKDTILAQYDNGLYLTLFEGLDFAAIKNKALEIQRDATEHTKKQKIKPLIGLYALDVNDLELNEILKIISGIAIEDISSKDIESQTLHRVLNLNEELDDNRAIDIFLQTAFINKAPIKLANIYKGLCIKTSSVIVKKTDQEVYVTFEQLQGIAMQFEENTVIQSSSFSNDILADVNFVNAKKKIAQLKNFRFVKGSANARKYSRVTCSVRTPISISYKKETQIGEILDVSMNSIAIKTRIYHNLKDMQGETVILNFTLPIRSIDEEFSRLTLSAKLIASICDGEYSKVIVNLDEDQSSEPILMEYVYNRQKEIIEELKKQTIVFK